MADGTRKQARDIQFMDLVLTDDGPAAVECIVRQHDDRSSVAPPAGMGVSNWHPIVSDGAWVNNLWTSVPLKERIWQFPNDCFRTVFPAVPDAWWYDFVLEPGKTHLYATHAPAVTSCIFKYISLANGIKDNTICFHPYYSSEQCRQELARYMSVDHIASLDCNPWLRDANNVAIGVDPSKVI